LYEKAKNKSTMSAVEFDYDTFLGGLESSDTLSNHTV
jgi:hypothetical protein